MANLATLLEHGPNRRQRSDSRLPHTTLPAFESGTSPGHGQQKISTYYDTKKLFTNDKHSNTNKYVPYKVTQYSNICTDEEYILLTNM